VVEWRAQLGSGAVDPRIKDLRMLAGMPDAARPLVAAMLRLQGQRTLARNMAGRPPQPAHLRTTGAGKSFLACALTHAAVRRGATALYAHATSAGRTGAQPW